MFARFTTLALAACALSSTDAFGQVYYGGYHLGPNHGEMARPAANPKNGQISWLGLTKYVENELPDAVKAEKGPLLKQTPEIRGEVCGLVMARLDPSSMKADRGKAAPGGLEKALPGEREETFEYVFEKEKKAGECRVITVDLGKGEKMELVRIKAGPFMMGSFEGEKDAADDEKPRHRVEITKDYYMGKYLVTQGQYEAVMGVNPSRFKGDMQLPVEEVSWEDAKAFCKALQQKLGRKVDLPSEAQWEYAGRAGTTTPYHVGNKLTEDLSNFDGKATSKVGKYPANPWGLYDMQGNVWQWCGDMYDEKYYEMSRSRDPQGPENGAERVLRGGSWVSTPRTCRVASRVWSDPSRRHNYVGFRVVCQDDNLQTQVSPAMLMLE